MFEGTSVSCRRASSSKRCDPSASNIAKHVPHTHMMHNPATPYCCAGGDNDGGHFKCDSGIVLDADESAASTTAMNAAFEEYLKVVSA